MRYGRKERMPSSTHRCFRRSSVWWIWWMVGVVSYSTLFVAADTKVPWLGGAAAGCDPAHTTTHRKIPHSWQDPSAEVVAAAPSSSRAFLAKNHLLAAYASSTPLLDPNSNSTTMISSIPPHVFKNHHHHHHHQAALNYTIFTKGRSALRDLPLEWRERLEKDLFLPTRTDKNNHNNNNTAKAIGALELIEAGYLDAAHEVLLGVSFQELEAAEYAGSHRGENTTTWNQDHPLDETDDFLHSLIHRLEGQQRGEGGYTGYQNAKYWIAGGPKSLSFLPTTDHPVYQALAKYASQVHPNLIVGAQSTKTSSQSYSSNLSTTSSLSPLVPTMDVSHEIIAGGGGRNRTVLVRAGSWDGIALMDYWNHVSSSPPPNDGRRSSSSSLEWQLYDLHCAELLFWRHYLLLLAMDHSNDSSTTTTATAASPGPRAGNRLDVASYF